jgi:KipI family sensor histidine kinase inhibitor
VSSVGIRNSGFGIRDAGDSAILLELEPVIDPAVNARAIVIATAVRDRRLDGVRDVIPTYRSVAVHFDPLTCDIDFLRDTMREAAAKPRVSASGVLVEVPVAYGGVNGPDLDDVAAFARLSAKTVIDRHCGPEYRVFMLGFLPGFAYMGIVDESIAAPRKATPRTRIPAGSIGIAGRQTGVYPRSSPGGWQLIGRTSLQVFDPSREPASLFQAGDRVKFVPIGNHSPVARTHEVRTDAKSTSNSASHKGLRHREGTSGRWLTVIRPGLFTTIQDSGRWGYQDRGVPVSGPMDRQALRLAHAVVGNPLDAAALEVTLLGPELRFDQPALIAVAGADLEAAVDGKPVALDTPHRVPSGGILRFGARRSGTRAYVALDGGIDVPSVLGSRSTHVISALGGIEGRALRAGDRVPVGTSNHLLREPLRFAPRVTGTSTAPQEPGTAHGARLRAMRGPQDYYFEESAFDWLTRTRFTISPQSDRMGYRLIAGSERTRPPSAITNPGNRGSGAMISDAAFTGGIQIPPSGEPILLMVDRQTTGGYPQIGTVITADLGLAGQLAPGDWIEFAWCTRVEAIAALEEQEEASGAR